MQLNPRSARMNADTPATRSLTAGAIAHRPLALGLAVLLLGSAAVESHADEERRFHVRPFVGYAMPDKVTTEDEVGIVTADIATEDSASFGISIGTEMFLDHLLWEVEYAHRKADVDGSSFLDVPAGIPLFGGDALTLPTTVKGDVTAQSLMLNVAYFFNLGGKISPFLQAGVGYATVEVDSLAFSTDFGDALVPGADNDQVAYGYGVGVAVQVAPNIALDLLYRRIDYGTVYSDPSPTGLGKDEFNVEVGEISLGARISF